MTVSPVVMKKWKDTADQILHVPGNYGGKMLEMTVVVDCSLEKEAVAELLPQLLRALKTHSRVFQNVRFNAVFWESDEKISNRVCPMMAAMLGSFYENNPCIFRKKKLEVLAEYLKKFHARSKLVVLLTDGKYLIEDTERLKSALQPFLERKMMAVCIRGEQLEIRYRSLDAALRS